MLLRSPFFVSTLLLLAAPMAQAQRSRITCSATEDLVGTPSNQPRAAPLRGSVGCIDVAAQAKRDVGEFPIVQGQAAVNVYGPMEAGFTQNGTFMFSRKQEDPMFATATAGANGFDTMRMFLATGAVANAFLTLALMAHGVLSDTCVGFFSHYPSLLVPGMRCLGQNVVPGGIDTNLAEHMVEYFCNGQEISALDGCGGHAMPYHYHERMQCLYESDPRTGHSTRIGTAADGNGIYGRFIDGGVEPTDLDACGGRFGVTPDSNGQVVYYYPVTSAAPFVLACYGPVNSVQECRDLYPATCGATAEVVEVTTMYGTGLYTLDCPCFDENESNVIGQGRPGYLEGGGPAPSPPPRPAPRPAPVPPPTRPPRLMCRRGRCGTSSFYQW